MPALGNGVCCWLSVFGFPISQSIRWQFPGLHQATVSFLEVKHLWSHSNRIHMGVATGVIFYLRILWPTPPTLATLQVATKGNEKPHESSQPPDKMPSTPACFPDSLNQTAQNHGAKGHKRNDHRSKASFRSQLGSYSQGKSCSRSGEPSLLGPRQQEWGHRTLHFLPDSSLVYDSVSNKQALEY